MGINNRQRRAAKKRDRAQRAPGRSPADNSWRSPADNSWRSPADNSWRSPADNSWRSPADNSWQGFNPTQAFVRPDHRQVDRDAAIWRIRDLIERGIVLVEYDAKIDATSDLVLSLIKLSDASSDRAGDPEWIVTEEVLVMLARSWEYGWQPLDLVHTLGRSSRRLRDLTASAVVEQSQRGNALQHAPEDWLSQLRVIADEADTRPSTGDSTPSWRVTRQRSDPREGWVDALLLLSRLRVLHPQPLLSPPPSQWRNRSHTQPASTAHHHSDAKVLGRIRALLAKAEATEFAEEAEAFTAKAQDLMTRHSIDEALLQADNEQLSEASARRVHIDDPYAATKAGLLHTVGHPNRVKVIWDDRAGIATVVGMAVDLEQVTMLFTSLLIQATRAMTEAGRLPGSASMRRSTSFRRSFLSAYAVRIGQRLTKATDVAAAGYGAELVPVFARQQETIDEEFERLFPNTTTKSSRASINAHGWNAGVAAADKAVLPAGQVEG